MIYLSVRKIVTRLCLFLFAFLFVLGIINSSLISVQAQEKNPNTISKLSQEELDMKALEANAVAQAVLLAIKNGALGEQFVNTNPSSNALPDTTDLENQSKKIDALQASYDNASLRLDKMFKIIIVLSCFLMAQLLLIISLYYLLLKKFQE